MDRCALVLLVALLSACSTSEPPTPVVVRASASALAEHPRFSAADYDRHIEALSSRIPRGFTVVVEPPFVVIGDESPARVVRRAQVVRWAVRMLRQDFFAEDPTRILSIWLFGGRASYRDHALALFGDVPTTPYGYYSAEEDALIMNIATGGGTLVHEIVHPFVEANMPDSPAWLNEGLGSLYEASDEQDGHMVGLVNWRLPGLQRAIGRDAVPPIGALARMSDSTFYGRGSGVHYAAARYLMYYLQESGLLRRFVAEALAHRDDDPSALATLSRVLDEPDMLGFQDHWERWVTFLHPR